MVSVARLHRYRNWDQFLRFAFYRQFRANVPLRLRMLGSRLRWVTEESRSGNFCVRSKDLPAARYRVAIRVFENSDDAAKMVGGRVITHDFVMSEKTQTVVVPIADDTKEQCGPTPAQSLAACSENSARETGCGLQDSVAFGWEGGNSLFEDSFKLEAPNAISISRQSRFETTKAVAPCTAALPICSLDARVVTTADLAHALAHPNIKNSFETQTVFYGHDPRSTDGAILVIRRTDGTSLGIGGPCIADDRLCQRALKPGMLELSMLLARLAEQTRNLPACAAFRL